MKVNFLLNPANRSWIIEKIAENLARDIKCLGWRSSITETVDDEADIVHHMSWAFARIKTRQPSTMFITHLDDIYKLNHVRATLTSYVRAGICMSSDTMQQLIQHGCIDRSLCFINPAHDGKITPRKIVIGITSRIYPDGRKREGLLEAVAQRIDLTTFEFRIFGRGWEKTIKWLQLAGATVHYFSESDDFRKDYQTLISEIPNFDFYLYLGLDEGSLGTLDALSAGIPTIVTPQGFHLDIPHGITHPVVTAEDLERVLAEISDARQVRIDSVRALTWERYALEHRAVWDAILSGNELPSCHYGESGLNNENLVVKKIREKRVLANSFRLSRAISAVSHLPWFHSFRRAVDRFRLGK